MLFTEWWNVIACTFENASTMGKTVKENTFLKGELPFAEAKFTSLHEVVAIKLPSQSY